MAPRQPKSESYLDKKQILAHAIQIAEAYRAQGLKLTLRQLYYQFVARGLMDSGQAVYNRIGVVLTEARYDGGFPIEMLEDRGRDVKIGDFLTDRTDIDAAEQNARDYVTSIPSWVIERARWYGQKEHVSVFVEKEALSGVFEDPCARLGVSMFACRGYPSVSSLWEWVKNVDAATRANRQIRTARVLYFGDHDPDGWEIPRATLRNIGKLRKTYGKASRVEIVFNRIALNMPQIEKYEPPPFDAKVTSPRYEGYVREHDTEDAWELDALEPSQLRKLIESNVSQHFDTAIFEENLRIVRAGRAEARSRMAEPGWIEDAFGKLDPDDDDAGDDEDGDNDEE